MDVNKIASWIAIVAAVVWVAHYLERLEDGCKCKKRSSGGFADWDDGPQRPACRGPSVLVRNAGG